MKSPTTCLTFLKIISIWMTLNTGVNSFSVSNVRPSSTPRLDSLRTKVLIEPPKTTVSMSLPKKNTVSNQLFSSSHSSSSSSYPTDSDDVKDSGTVLLDENLKRQQIAKVCTMIVLS